MIMLKLWKNTPKFPAAHGYTPAAEDEIATFRIGPIVIGWDYWDLEQ
jgi:hypothetical protein